MNKKVEEKKWPPELPRTRKENILKMYRDILEGNVEAPKNDIYKKLEAESPIQQKKLFFNFEKTNSPKSESQSKMSLNQPTPHKENSYLKDNQNLEEKLMIVQKPSLSQLYEVINENDIPIEIEIQTEKNIPNSSPKTPALYQNNSSEKKVDDLYSQSPNIARKPDIMCGNKRHQDEENETIELPDFLPFKKKQQVIEVEVPTCLEGFMRESNAELLNSPLTKKLSKSLVKCGGLDTKTDKLVKADRPSNEIIEEGDDKYDKISNIVQKRKLTTFNEQTPEIKQEQTPEIQQEQNKNTTPMYSVKGNGKTKFFFGKPKDMSERRKLARLFTHVIKEKIINKERKSPNSGKMISPKSDLKMEEFSKSPNM